MIRNRVIELNEEAFSVVDSRDKWEPELLLLWGG